MTPSLFTEEQKRIILSGKFNSTDLGAQWGILPIRITTYAYRHNVKLPRKINQGKNVENHNLFKTLDMNSAYLVGFLLADGYLYFSKRGAYKIQINLSNKDLDHLEKIAKLFHGRFKISSYTHKQGHECCVLTVYSPQMFNDLIYWGVTPKKTYTTKWVDHWPQEYISHIVRGIVDGDGTLTFFQDKRKRYRELRVGISGMENLMRGIQNAFSGVIGRKVGSVIPSNQGVHFYYNLGGSINVLSFCQWIYKDSSPENRMDRKYINYRKFLEDYLNNPRAHIHFPRNHHLLQEFDLARRCT